MAELNQPNASIHRPLTAKDVMTTKLITLHPRQDVFEAIDTLLDNNISEAPVVKESLQLVGILSKQDCLRALINAMYEKLPFPPVQEAMTKSVQTVEPSTNILTLAHLFMNHSLSRLPVIEDGALVGLVNRQDLLREIARIMRSVPHYEAASLYLSAVDEEARAKVT